MSMRVMSMFLGFMREGLAAEGPLGERAVAANIFSISILSN
jgi:hypothetical protein